MRNHRLKFWQFHFDNPQVYKTLVKMARQYRARRPGQRIGIGTLWEALRWDYQLNIKTDEDFKLHDTNRAFYARLIMIKNHDLAGLFQLKRSCADNDPILRRMEDE